MKLNDYVTFKFGGKNVLGRITGKHGDADYFAVKICETGETVYRWAADMDLVNLDRVFKDTENGGFVNMLDLLNEYIDGASDAETFGAYVANCQTYNGGTLDEMRSKPIYKMAWSPNQGEATYTRTFDTAAERDSFVNDIKRIARSVSVWDGHVLVW